MNLKKTYVPKIGYTEICKTGECSLKLLDFGMVELKKGDSVTISRSTVRSGKTSAAAARCLKERPRACICRGTKRSPSPAAST